MKIAALRKDIAPVLEGTNPHRYDAMELGRKLRRALRPSLGTCKIRSGAYRLALVFDEVVVKIPFYRDRTDEMLEETQLFNSLRRKRSLRKHFPRTMAVQVGRLVVQVQERCKARYDREVAKAVRGLEDREIPGHPDLHVERFAASLGIDDMHEQNFVWDVDTSGFPFPVMFDIELNESPEVDGKVLTWKAFLRREEKRAYRRDSSETFWRTPRASNY